MLHALEQLPADQTPEGMALLQRPERREAHVHAGLVLHAVDEDGVLHARADVVDLVAVEDGEPVLEGLHVVPHDGLQVGVLGKHLPQGLTREAQELAVHLRGRRAEEVPRDPHRRLGDPRAGPHDVAVNNTVDLARRKRHGMALRHVGAGDDLRVAEGALGHDEGPVGPAVGVEELPARLHVDGLHGPGAQGLGDVEVEVVPSPENRVGEHELGPHILPQL
mmetsp:Transcript_2030/g.6145  ORF Transcript_2030/g.6145 Transcript_2030/m.6145 type:complete len:221 (+) Transcript_2030:299-961(+)